MASRLAFQTQLASIMEVLANAAVAEICKLVDDDYAVVSLQMSQCQRENKALKRKLNLMELKMARGFAERRLRDSAASIGRTRVHVGSNDRFRSSSAASGVVFEGQMDMVPWPGGVVPGAASRETTTCDLQQDMSADVELVEAELVKQEKMEEAEEDVEEEVQLIRADGQMERGPGGGRVQRSSRPQQEVQAAYHHNECPDPAPSASTRGVENEEEPDVKRVKQEAGLESPDHAHPTLIIQEGLVESSTDDYKASLSLDGVSQPAQELQECGQGFSEVSFDPSSLWTYGGVGLSGGVGLPRPSSPSSPLNRTLVAGPPNGLAAGGSGGLGLAAGGSGGLGLAAGASGGLGLAAGGSSGLGLSVSGGRGLASAGSSGRGLASAGSSGRGLASAGSSGRVLGVGGGSTFHSRDSFLSQDSSSIQAVLRGQGSQYVAQSLDPSGSRGASSVARRPSPTKRAWACSFCGKAFRSPANLESHLRTHTGERPYGCTVCGKKFSQLWNLKIHGNTHTGERPYQCPLCPERFSDPSNLKKHQRRHHPST
ncbi:zinc finger protein Gfi-1-like isoform X1 [Gadus chalcogrammus]|uniref:zinc finger protein Gfi-1-like isoform X1 n=1 Tax=Gadus chalcogrammus TaxID=1042646 RepID=UPI0024C3A2D2|nr:zinc finger protein Gfi-1-like isoform X1 [Gadus chalcogrammus]